MTTAPSSGLYLDPATGFLPCGRHQTSLHAVRQRFVDHPEFAESSTRAEAWDEFELGHDMLRSKVRVHSIWFGGSFLTAKVDAQDVDALFIINARDFKRLSIPDRQIVAAFTPRPGPLGTPVRGHGLDRLDSFLLHWSPFSPFKLGQEPAHTEYAAHRGYWDDWWPRDRYNKPSGAPPHWKDALPVRGYLEVIIDAYDR